MRGGSDCCGNFCVIRPIEGNPRQSRILDSTPWVPDSRYWTPFFAVELGLWFPMASGILDSLSCVPNPKGQDFGFHIKITLDSIFHQQKFPGFIKDRTGGGAAVGALVQPPPATFSDGNFFFYTLVTQICHLPHKQARFSNLTILNTHKKRTGKLCLVAVTNEFVALNNNRRGNFGHI